MNRFHLKKTTKTTVNLLKNLRDSFLYQFSKRYYPNKNPENIVFVCKGNICRSPFAQYQMTAVNGDRFTVKSFGLEVNTPAPSPQQAKMAALQFGIDLKDHVATPIDQELVERADLILAMEYWQYKKLTMLFPKKKRQIRLLREFTPFPENLLCNIEDPFNKGEIKFILCFDQIKRAVDGVYRYFSGNGERNEYQNCKG